MPVLEIRDLKKSFGAHQVIDGLDLAVPERSVFGFIGPNGSGKTTTMKLILGLLRPDSGTIKVCGEQVSYGETKTNRHIGYLPDVPEFYGYMRPAEYLRLCGTITNMKKSSIEKRSAELLDLVGLIEADRKIAGFSRGMKQRLGIAQALLNEPSLLICDEPTSALDPVGRREILDILLAVREKTTVVFSTHILSDVEHICDHVAVLNEGRIRLVGTLSDIKAHHTHEGYLIEFENERDLSQFTSSEMFLEGGIQLVQEGLMVNITLSSTKASTKREYVDLGQGNDRRGSGNDLIRLLADLSITPTRFEILEPTLEHLFMEVVR